MRSPSTWRYDRGVKRERYARWGVEELWLVDTKRNEVRTCRRTAPGLDAYDAEAVVPAGEPLTSPLVAVIILLVALLIVRRELRAAGLPTTTSVGADAVVAGVAEPVPARSEVAGPPSRTGPRTPT